MSRVNDVGGQSGFGAVPVEPDEPPFHADWEARVFAVNTALLRRGSYTLDELRDAIERMPPRDYLAASYYERWLVAIETLLMEKALLPERGGLPVDAQNRAEGSEGTGHGGATDG